MDGRMDGADWIFPWSTHTYRQYWLAWSETENNWESHSSGTAACLLIWAVGFGHWHRRMRMIPVVYFDT